MATEYDLTLGFPAAAGATSASRGFDAAAEAVDRGVSELAQVASTLTVNAAIDRLGGEVIPSFRRAADSTALVAAATAEGERAWREWRASAPPIHEIEAAKAAVADARAAYRHALDIGGADAPAAKAAVDTAERKLFDLRARREAVNAALAAALQKAAEKLRGKGGWKDHGGTSRGPTAPTTPSRGPAVTDPAPRQPSPAPARTPTPSTPAPAPSPSMPDPGIASLLSQLRQQPQAPAPSTQQQQPQQQPALTPPAAALSVPKPGNDKDKPFNADDLDAAIAPAPVALPATVPPTAPATGQHAAPLATPAVSGTSVSGLHTPADVGGRSEGARTALSTVLTDNVRAAAGTGVGAGAGQPGAGAMPPTPLVPMGTPGGGGAGPGKPVLRHNAEQDFMHGRLATGPGEAVRGGTIAQRRDGGDAT